MTVQGWIYLSLAMLLWIPFTRAASRYDDRPDPGPGDIGWYLFCGAAVAAFWPLAAVGAVAWWLLNRPLLARVTVSESKDARIRRLEQRNEQLERELGL